MTGEEFKRALADLGWKQADLARKTGTHRNTVSGWAADGAPLWVSEYLGALLGIKGLHETFLEDEPMEGSRAARMASALESYEPKE